MSCNMKYKDNKALTLFKNIVTYHVTIMLKSVNDVAAVRA